MGDTFEWWSKTEKAYALKKDYAGLLTEMEKLLEAMKVYAVALMGRRPEEVQGQRRE